MDNIQDVKVFNSLSKKEKATLYDNEINRIESYIYNSAWYLAQSKEVRKIVRKHKPWLLYQTNEDTPARIYGFIMENNIVSYLVATMDENGGLIIGQLQDIDRIQPVKWEDINHVYLFHLIKGHKNGLDIVFLKPEMFLLIGSTYAAT